MFGFPASFRDTYECALGSHSAGRIIAAAFEDLGWEYSVSEYGRFMAIRPVSLQSWGEIVTVEVLEHDLISVESRCRSFSQVFDWGKNRFNVREFIGHLEQNEIRYKALGAGSLDENFEKDGSSRIERLFDRSGDETKAGKY